MSCRGIIFNDSSKPESFVSGYAQNRHEVVEDNILVLFHGFVLVQDLKERMAQVDEWKKRRDEIEKELAQVWVEGAGDEPLEQPEYIQKEEQTTSIEQPVEQ